MSTEKQGTERKRIEYSMSECISSSNLFENMTYMRGSPKMEFTDKQLCTYSYMFKSPSPSKCSPCDAIHLPRCFSHGSKQFLNSSILMPFSASAIVCLFVCFTSSTSAKHFPLRTLLIQGNKQSCSRQDLVNREGEAWGSCHFWLKTAEHSAQCGEVLL